MKQFQVKIPCKQHDVLSDAQMAQFLQTLCQTCGSCLRLITLDPGPEQCDDCAAEEAKELQRERDEETKRQRIKEAQLHAEQLDRIKRELDKTNAIWTKFKNFLNFIYILVNRDAHVEYDFDEDDDVVEDAIENDDDDDAFAGVSDIESSTSNFDQEENVSSTVAAIQAATATSTSTISISSSSNTNNIPACLPNEMKTTKSTSPNEWSVEDVIEFIAETDPALSIHAELFRKHVSR